MKNIFNHQVITSAVIILLCILFCVFSKKMVLKLFKKKKSLLQNNKQRTVINLVNNLLRIFVAGIALIVILETLGVDTKSFVASLGVFSLVIGLAVQDVLKDFITGMSLILEGQYNIGDWVEINGFKGEVLTSNFRTTKLRAYTGEIKIISNRNINEIINYSLSKSTSIIDVSVAYESDIKRVKSVLDDLCEKLKKEKNIEEIECLGIQCLEDNGIAYRLIAKGNYLEQIPLARVIKAEIIQTFNDNKIVIPYQQVVIHNAKGI